MGIRTLYDPTENRAVMYDSVTEYAFGPVFTYGDNGMHPVEAVDKFVAYADGQGIDLRSCNIDELNALCGDWRKWSGYDDG